MPLSPTEQIAQLLAQADGTTHEAEKLLAYERAQLLASRHSIDLAVARAALAKTQEREKPIMKNIVLGQSGQRALSWYVELMCAIARANDLKVTISTRSTYVNLFGFPSDIEVAQAIYMSTITAMVQGGDEYLKKGDYKKEILPLQKKKRRPNPHYGVYYNEPKFEYYWTTEYKAISGLTARQNFYAGFVQRIGARLMEAKRSATQAAKEQAATAENVELAQTSTALVLADKKAEVDLFYQETARVGRGSWNGSRTPVHSSSAQAAGRSHASSVSLGGTKGIGGGRTQIGS